MNEKILRQSRSLNIIEDTPADDDNFQSHEKISKAIGNIICEGKGGVTIGVEGAWGSGKSTVIRLLQKNLVNDKDIFFFIFDAWVHQGDPLRRAFLEGLISDAINKSWLFRKRNEGELNEKWNREKEALSKKTKVLTKSVEPVITGFGKILLISILFFPFGSSIVVNLLRPSANSNLVLWPTSFDQAAVHIGMFFMCLPFLIMLMNWLWFKGDEKKKDSLFSIFYQKSHIDEVSTTSESLEPSTIEFQQKFEQLMSDLLQPEGTKLVIVLDNLDRLSSKEASEVWPVLRSFIDNPKFTKSPWFRRLWVLVPYAYDGLDDQTGKSYPGQNSDSGAAPKDETDKIDSSGSKNKDPHFLEKIFQLKIFLPAPILSNWKSYLENLLTQAFGNECDAEKKHVIYILLTRYYGFLNPPGPRELKNIVNGMVGTAFQWGFEIPIEHQAYFVLLKRDKGSGNLRTKLRNNEVNLHADLLGEDVRRSLISLECNVRPEDAEQTLYGPVISDLLSKDADIGDLAERYKNPGFSALFDIVIGEILSENAGSNSSLFMRNIHVLCTSELFQENSQIKKTILIREVSRAIEKLSYLPVSVSITFESVISLAKFDLEKLAAQSVRDALGRTMEFFKNGARESGLFQRNSVTLEFLKGAYLLWGSEELKEYLGHNFLISFYFPAGQDEYLRVYKLLRPTDDFAFLDAFDLSKPHREMFKKLEGLDSKTQVSVHLENIDILRERGEDIPDWVYHTMVAKVDPFGGKVDDVFEWLSYLAQESFYNKLIADELEELAVRGVMYYYLAAYDPDLSEKSGRTVMLVSRQDKVDLCAKILYLILRTYPLENSRPDLVDVVKGAEFFDAIIHAPTNYHEILSSMHAFVSHAGMLDIFLEKLGASELSDIRLVINSFEHVEMPS